MDSIWLCLFEILFAYTTNTHTLIHPAKWCSSCVSIVLFFYYLQCKTPTNLSKVTANKNQIMTTRRSLHVHSYRSFNIKIEAYIAFLVSNQGQNIRNLSPLAGKVVWFPVLQEIIKYDHKLVKFY